jgi:tRNA pseudouridine38-40 synthase
MKRFLMQLSYDGTFFSGWQTQPQVRTVQQVLEPTLSKIAKQTTPIVGSGRTDAGVHALNQYAHFDFPISMQPKQIVAALNSLLPEDILIKQIWEVPADFHARYDASKRTYLYIITKKRTPFNRFYQSYFPKKNLNISIIDQAAQLFLGKHDFTAFSKFNPDVKTQICEIYNFNCYENTDTITLQIEANRFLHNMVRRVVGTLVNISHKEQEISIITELLAARSPQSNLISTAPPQGLYLQNVEYPNLS